MKNIASFLCAIALMLTLVTYAYAEPSDYKYVFDYADVLTNSDESSVEKRLEEIKLKYGLPFVVITKYGVADYTSSQYAESFYSGNSQLFEVNNTSVGFIFVDDFDNDKFYIYTVGDGDSVISDAQVDSLYDMFNSNYNASDYFGSYTKFILEIEKYYAAFADKDFGGSEPTSAPYGDDYDFSAPDSQGAYITDKADLFTDDEEASLLRKAEIMMAKYNIDIVLHTTNSIGEKSVQDYADDYYDYNGYGVGESKDGLLFMLNMNNGEEGNRDYYTSTTGSAITALTDYAIKDSDSYINSEVLPLLSSGDYYEAFNKYLDLIDIFFAQAATGVPYDNGNPYKSAEDVRNSIIIAEVFVIGFSLLIATIVVSKLKKKMSTAEIKTQAYDYLKPGSTIITNSADRFSYRTVTQTAKPKETSSSSSSGSSTHTSSSGTSHGGGGGKF